MHSTFENPDELRTVLETVQDGLFIISGERLVFVNQAFADIVGASTEALIDEPFIKHIAPHHREMVAGRYQRRLAGEPSPPEYEFDVVHEDGSIRSVHMRVGVITRPDGSKLAVGTMRDVTEQKRLIEQLRASEADFRNIVNNLPDVFYRTDPEGVITMASAYCEEALGYKPEEVIGHKMADFFVEPSDRDRVLDAIRANGGRVTTVETKMLDKDGGILWASTNTYFRYDADGNFLGTEGVVRNITPRKHMEDKLRHTATHDPLTGLINRSEAMARLEAALARAARAEEQVAVVFIDLDGFKPVNDRFGHRAGDQVLAEVGKRLASTVRDTDVVGRLGGDEFVLILEGRLTPEKIRAICQSAIAMLSQPYAVSGEEVQIGVSCGVAQSPADGSIGELLLRRADRAMYRAKAEGGGRCAFAAGLDEN